MSFEEKRRILYKGERMNIFPILKYFPHTLFNPEEENDPDETILWESDEEDNLTTHLASSQRPEDKEERKVNTAIPGKFISLKC